jgi:DNA modification methylase
LSATLLWLYTGVLVSEKRYKKRERRQLINFRLSASENAALKRDAKTAGVKSVSEYLRRLITRNGVSAITNGKSAPAEIEEALTTDLGRIYCGDSLTMMRSVLKDSSVDLIMTSPPFGLLREKSYGNAPAHKYLEWFRPFAEAFRRILKPHGSLVIDIGGAWKERQPTRSLYQFKLLLMLCEEYGFHLAQDFYWWNPARLPSPAEWVNVRRIRVKDAVNTVWWLSRSPWPKASNRRVLTEYSKSMKGLIKTGEYNAGERPSGHNISKVFSRDNGGAISSNLIAAPNTGSTEFYQRYCREHGLPIHPARFPRDLPEFFIRMLTDPGDLVIDPFGGSCLTGEVSELLGRRWICGEIHKPFVKGAKARFLPEAQRGETNGREGYKVPPIQKFDPKGEKRRLPKHGGRLTV